MAVFLRRLFFTSFRINIASDILPHVQGESPELIAEVIVTLPEVSPEDRVDKVRKDKAPRVEWQREERQEEADLPPAKRPKVCLAESVPGPMGPTI